MVKPRRIARVPDWQVGREALVAALGALCGATGRVAKPEEW